jgi:hypothetical protein
MVLIMSVNPVSAASPSSEVEQDWRLEAMFQGLGARAEIEVDGGIKVDNVANVAAVGGQVWCPDSGIFGARLRGSIRRLEAKRKRRLTADRHFQAVPENGGSRSGYQTPLRRMTARRSRRSVWTAR